MSANILITGANYNNKGAQSMLFIAVDEIAKRIPDAQIFFGCGDKDPILKGMRFKQICFSREARYIALGGLEGFVNLGIAICKAVLATLKGKRLCQWRFFDVKKNMDKMDCVIDVSGFTLGDKWSRRTNENFLNIIRLAKKHNIPIFIMPQSFGPFEFNAKMRYLNDEIKELLAYPRIIYAREKEGYDFLSRDYGLKNVKLSYDLVLQNDGINIDNIFKKNPQIKLPVIKTEHNVAIIPNVKCILHLDKEKILERYRHILDRLLEKQIDIYIFRHSKEDMSLCREIASMYDGNPHVHLLENDFSCLDYDEFVKNFDFIVCSRYHGIVHAYRNSIPALALGWAVKYRELAKAVGQDEYIVNFTSRELDVDDILSLVNRLLDNYENERKIIEESVKKIKQENCFICLSDWVKNDYE